RCRRVDTSGCQNVVDQHPFPRGIELGPGGDAMDVTRHMRDRQGVEFGPAPGLQWSRPDLEREDPVRDADARRWPGTQHREALFKMLSRWNAAAQIGRPWAAGKASGRRHTDLLLSACEYTECVATKISGNEEQSSDAYGSCGIRWLKCELTSDQHASSPL